MIFHLPKQFSEKYWIPSPIRWEKVNNRYLVSTDWSWILLEDSEFKLLLEGKIEEDINLFKKLEDSGIILTKDNLKKIIKKYQDRYHFLWQGPSLHIIAVTFRCNQACIYCHSSVVPDSFQKTKYDLDIETAKEIVDFIFQSNANHIGIEFQGGEPLLNWEVIEYIVERAIEKSKIHKKIVNFNMATNLTLMTEDLINKIINDYWIKRKIKFGFSTSLDGPKEVHDKNRPMRNGGSSYERVVYWLEWLWERHKWVPHALLTITKNSLPYWKEIVDEYINRHQLTIWIRIPNRIGYAKNNPNNVTEEEYLEFFKKSLEYIIEINKKKRIFIEYYTLIILKKLFNNKDPLFTDLMSPICGGIIGQLAYKPNGDIHTCDEGKIYDEFKLGNVKTDTLKDILNSEKARLFFRASCLETYPTCIQCVYKFICGACPVNSFAEFNTMFPHMPSFYKCKINKNIFRTIFEKLQDKEVKSIFETWLKIL